VFDESRIKCYRLAMWTELVGKNATNLKVNNIISKYVINLS